MTFQEAEKAYKELRAQYSAGKLSSTDFENEVSKLKLQDTDGRWWQIGVQSGDWYVHDGQKWSKGSPPGEEPEEEVPAGPPEIPPVQRVSPPTSTAAPAASTAPSTPPATERPGHLPVRLSAAPQGRGPAGLPVPLVVGIIVVAAIVGIGILFAAYSFLSGQLNLSGTVAQVATATPSSAPATATLSLTGLVRTTPIPTLPSATDTSVPIPTMAVVLTATLPTVPMTQTVAATTPKPASATRTPTPTRKAVTPSPTATATLQLASGIYVTKVQLDPPQPSFNVPVGFKVTLLNTTGTMQTYKWLVKIFQCAANPCVGDDFRRSIGESTMMTSNLPAGSSDVVAPPHWTVGLGACTYVAMPHYVDPVGQVVTPFRQPNGQPMYFVFSMCH